MKKTASIFLLLLTLVLPTALWAQEPAPAAPANPAAEKPAPEATAPDKKPEKKGADTTIIFITVAATIAVAAFGGVLAQGWVGSSAMAGVARNPGSKSQVQTLLLLTLVLIESLVIYALVVSLLLYAKL